MKAVTSPSLSDMSFVYRVFMPVNTRHFSFLEGERSHFSKEDDMSYRMHIHGLRIGTFACIVGLTALAICI